MKPPTDAKKKALAWCGVVVAALGLLGWQLQQGVQQRIETNLLKLLPETEQDPAVFHALETFTHELSRRMIFLLRSDDLSRTREAARLLGERLSNSSSVDRVRYEVDSNIEKAFYDLYFPYRFQLLSEDIRGRLRTEAGVESIVRDAVVALHSPLSPLYTRILENDPLFLFPAWMQSRPAPPGNAGIEEGMITLPHPDGTYVLVTARLRDTPFARRTQELAIPELEAAEAAVRSRFPEVDLLSGGTLRFAHSGTQRAQRDTGIIGTGSLLGILLLIRLSFRRWQWLWVGVIPVAVGLLIAFAVSLTVFDKLHMITLGFGASLIGVCIDYTFHFFSDRVIQSDPGPPRSTLRRILPGITLGVLTSILGYIGLLVAPFPGLRQMALFSSLGLLGAYGTVVCWFPFLCGKAPGAPGPLARAVSRRYDRWKNALGGRKLRWVCGLTALLIIPGLLRLEMDDDIRRLQQLDPDLVDIQNKIGSLSGGVDQGQFLVLTGPDGERVLQTAEDIIPKLRTLVSDGTLGYFQTLAHWVPSRKRQQDHRAAFQSALLKTGRLERHLRDLGFAEPILQKILQTAGSADMPILHPHEWLASPASEGLEMLWVEPPNEPPASIVLLGEVQNSSALREMAADLPGVTFVSQVEDYTALFQRFRRIATGLVAASYGVILLFLMVRYGTRQGIRLMLPPIAAAVFALGILGWTSLPVNIFNMLALLLVLGIGIDYTLFFAEATSAKDAHAVAVAVVISACSTVLSFGLLALSDTTFLRSFGLTVWLGLSIAMLLSPLASPAGLQNSSKPGRSPS